MFTIVCLLAGAHKLIKVSACTFAWCIKQKKELLFLSSFTLCPHGQNPCSFVVPSRPSSSNLLESSQPGPLLKVIHRGKEKGLGLTCCKKRMVNLDAGPVSTLMARRRSWTGRGIWRKRKEKTKWSWNDCIMTCNGWRNMINSNRGSCFSSFLLCHPPSYSL